MTSGTELPGVQPSPRLQDLAVAVLDALDRPRASVVTLNKLLYLVQGWHLALTGQPAFEDVILAGGRGPVVPAVQQACGDISTSRDEFTDALPARLPSHTARVVCAVVDAHGAKSDVALMRESMRTEPWLEAYERSVAGEPNARVDLEVMRTWFTAEAESARKRAASKRALAARMHGLGVGWAAPTA